MSPPSTAPQGPMHASVLSRALALSVEDVRAAPGGVLRAGLGPTALLTAACVVIYAGHLLLLTELGALAWRMEEEAVYIIGSLGSIAVTLTLFGTAVSISLHWCLRNLLRLPSLGVPETHPRPSFITIQAVLYNGVLMLSMVLCCLPLLAFAPLSLMLLGAMVYQGLPLGSALRFSVRHYLRHPTAATVDGLALSLLIVLVSMVPIVGWVACLPMSILLALRAYTAFYGDSAQPSVR